MNQTLLQVKDISYAYHTKSGETPALSHISFSVLQGEFVAIVGPSGCGKGMGVQRKLFVFLNICRFQMFYSLYHLSFYEQLRPIPHGTGDTDLHVFPFFPDT